MKIRSFMTMALAATFALGVCSCSNDDEDPVVAAADQVAGSYTGEEIMEVMGEGDANTNTYVFTKTSDNTLDMTIPETVDAGSMALPALPVKNITLEEGTTSITGKLASYAGTIINSSGVEKSYTVTDLTAIFSNKTVVLTYTLKYGNMPFAFTGKFTGTKQ